MPAQEDSSGPRETVGRRWQVNRKAFEALVQDAIRELPQEFKEKLRNVAIVVEDYPSEELLDRLGVPEDETLFGLYEGVPLTKRGFEAPLHPDRIFIFQEPIEGACDSPADIKEQVRITLVHEVAHFFGIDDDALEEMGYD
jgi:predicted Zn-dependent protease with MMP-like domain